MNIDTITDFLIIVFAEYIFENNEKSIFTGLAKFMQQAGHKSISKWLHGFEPTYINL
jgi:hypothetical protein